MSSYRNSSAFVWVQAEFRNRDLLSFPCVSKLLNAGQCWDVIWCCCNCCNCCCRCCSCCCNFRRWHSRQSVVSFLRKSTLDTFCMHVLMHNGPMHGGFAFDALRC
ncbi:unnamed protein product [Polarella glacialis]|uniref:Uncharacterized protein n=1 Tax=Polarella glacialis TaxID=89957 RepID=A0A813G4C2_POLGL|nr:unnamed protein product [Polarella glacialis]